MLANPIDHFVLARVRYRARALIGRFGLTSSDFDDLRQDLIVAVLEAMPAFNPAKALRETFIRRVLDRRCIDLIRRRRAGKRLTSGSTLSLDRMARDTRHDITADRRRPCSLSPLDQFELRHDINVMFGRLPIRLHSIARLLPDHSTSEIAQRLTVSQRTVRRDIELLPGFFAPVQRKNS